MSMQPHSKKRVCYYYDSDIGNYYYGQGHPMKPHRIRMTHNLLLNYGLYRKMEIYRPHKATSDEMTKFHSDDYIRFLRQIRPDNMSEHNKNMQRFNVGEDCPVFDGLYEFCQLSAGGSVAAAVKLNKQASEICINWGGGLHHAKKSEASGFCYVNDIVLGILELLKYHQRVLYIDIDVHHGDGVEEAFYTTDRVMTVSFHKYGEYFPGTGDLRDIGAGKGKYYAVNIPLRDGMDDDAYDSIFVPIIAKVMETFQPAAVVLQCGADSLTGDRLGCFNLTVKGHGKCVEFVKKYNLPFLMVGGGGYTIRNVSRCWTYETSVALGVEIANELPYNDYFEYFGPDFKLHISPSNMSNQNTAEYLEKIKTRLFENLRMLPHAPGVQIQAIPEDAVNDESEDEDKIDKDDRLPQSDKDKRIVPDNEYSDSEDEGEGGRRDQRSYKGQRKRPRLDKTNVSDATAQAAAAAVAANATAAAAANANSNSNNASTVAIVAAAAAAPNATASATAAGAVVAKSNNSTTAAAAGAAATATAAAPAAGGVADATVAAGAAAAGDAAAAAGATAASGKDEKDGKSNAFLTGAATSTNATATPSSILSSSSTSSSSSSSTSSANATASTIAATATLASGGSATSSTTTPSIAPTAVGTPSATTTSSSTSASVTVPAIATPSAGSATDTSAATTTGSLASTIDSSEDGKSAAAASTTAPSASAASSAASIATAAVAADEKEKMAPVG